jgi:hypothetical protein
VGDETPMISVSFTTNMAEQVAAARAVMRATLSNWAMFAMFVVGPLTLLLFSTREAGYGWPGWLPAGLAVGGAAFWWFFPWYIVWIVRRGMSHPDGPVTIAMGEVSVRIQSPVAATEVQWSAFLRARETQRFFLLYLSKSQAQPIPKRAMPSTEVERLRALVARRLGDRAKVSGAR